MSEVVLKAQRRDIGKKASKAVRNSGLVTGIYYSHGEEPIAISVHPLNMRPIVYTANAKIINLDVEGSNSTIKCMLKDISFDPVTDVIVHFDLFGVQEDKPINILVPVSFKGQSVGIKEGGILEHIIHKLPVVCLPKDLPEKLEIDITDLRIGHAIHVRDINFPGLTIKTNGDATIVAIAVPRKKDEVKS